MATVGTAVAAQGAVTERISITQTVTASINDFVQFLTVPQGLIVYDISLVYAGTSSSTASVGDTNVADRYIAATSTATTGKLSCAFTDMMTTGVVVSGRGYTYTAADTIGVTIAGAGVTAKTYTVNVTFGRAFGSVQSRKIEDALPGAGSDLGVILDAVAAANLSLSGVTAGTYNTVTVTNKGIVTTGANKGVDLGEFTIVNLPSASANANCYAVATNASGGRTVVRSNGTLWKVIAVEGSTVA